MSTTSVLEVAGGAASRIGSYFSVLTVVPSAVFVTYLKALSDSGAWSGPPDWSAAVHALTRPGLGGVVGLVLASLLLGLVLHPLQYAFVQFLEGYWGVSGVARHAAAVRIAHHRERRARLNTLQSRSAVAKKEHTGPKQVPYLVAFEEAERLLTSYPERATDVRPTRLGNMLRRYEARAGRAYGLPGVALAPHLALVAASRDVEYLNDQRTQLDLAVRLTVLAGLATAVSAVLLWRDGLWLLVAVVPYSFAYLFYRGSVVVAAEYGTALTTLVDLNRFALYDRLHLPLPASAELERRNNENLRNMVGGPTDVYHALYEHPAAPGADFQSGNH